MELGTGVKQKGGGLLVEVAAAELPAGHVDRAVRAVAHEDGAGDGAHDDRAVLALIHLHLLEGDSG